MLPSSLVIKLSIALLPVMTAISAILLLARVRLNHAVLSLKPYPSSVTSPSTTSPILTTIPANPVMKPSIILRAVPRVSWIKILNPAQASGVTVLPLTVLIASIASSAIVTQIK